MAGIIMAGQTSNYNFDYPTSTDYVKDGATAIQELADDVDATLFTALGGDYPGLRLVKKQTIGSAVSSVSVTDAFSATYESYKIIITGGASSAASGDLQLILTGSTANYANALIYFVYGDILRTASSASISSFQYAGSISSANIDLSCDIFNPFLAKHTTLKSIASSGTYSGVFGGVHKVATSYTGFTVTPSTGTITGGTIYVYGYGAS
jgi:hypothetical protein